MLDINPLLMLLVLVVFVILIYLLNEWLYKPLMGFMENRDRSIKNDLDSILGNDKEVTALQAEADQILAKAKKEAGSIKEEAYESAKKSADARVDAKRLELERQKADYMAQLQKEQKELRASLLSQMDVFKGSLKNKMQQL